MTTPYEDAFHRQRPINWRNILLGVAIALSTPAVMGMVGYVRGAWADKESAADHKADIASLRALQQRLLDVVCIDHPSARQCKEMSP